MTYEELKQKWNQSPHREGLLNAYNNSPVVNTAIHHAIEYGIPYDQALELAVVELWRQNSGMMKELIHAATSRPAAPITIG
jgi:hypothetical protein